MPCGEVDVGQLAQPAMQRVTGSRRSLPGWREGARVWASPPIRPVGPLRWLNARLLAQPNAISALKRTRHRSHLLLADLCPSSSSLRPLSRRSLVRRAQISTPPVWMLSAELMWKQETSRRLCQGRLLGETHNGYGAAIGLSRLRGNHDRFWTGFA
jgi:hypothetical protein